jgi:lysylphosphatidylglycerol synthetase-like protein (DUF2156 family)
MIQRLKIMLLSFSSLLFFAVPLAVSGVAHAQTTQQDINKHLCSGSSIDFTNSTDCSSTAGTGKSATDLVKSIINIISLLVGAVAVIMLIYGGFRYVTSGGKQESVTSAKNTIIYAIIGLVIVALAQVVVQFVLNKTNEALPQ